MTWAHLVQIASSVMGCWLEHESLTSTTLLKCALLLNNEQEVSVFCMYVIATYLV